MISVFDSVDLSKLFCTRAEKNIADDFDRKYVTTRLEFCDNSGKIVVALRSSCSRLDLNTVLYEDPVKISCDVFNKNLKVRARTFGLHDITQQIKKDVDTIERLFDNAPDETKRVY